MGAFVVPWGGGGQHSGTTIQGLGVMHECSLINNTTQYVLAHHLGHPILSGTQQLLVHHLGLLGQLLRATGSHVMQQEVLVM